MKALIIALLFALPAHADWVRDKATNTCMQVPSVEELIRAKAAEGLECKPFESKPMIFLMCKNKQMWVLSRDKASCDHFIESEKNPMKAVPLKKGIEI